MSIGPKVTERKEISSFSRHSRAVPKTVFLTRLSNGLLRLPQWPCMQTEVPTQSLPGHQAGEDALGCDGSLSWAGVVQNVTKT